MDILPPPPALPTGTTGKDTEALIVATEHEIETARSYLDASRAASTRRAYAGDWGRFETWCRERATPALPATPALVAVYLSALAATGHSGVDIWKIQQVSRHKSMQVLAGYVRDARLFDDHAGDGFL